jgi:hypothetical protein
VRPILVFNLYPAEDDRHGPRAHRFMVEVVNGGKGVAIDVRIDVSGELRYDRESGPVQPFAMLPDTAAVIEFRLDDARP